VTAKAEESRARILHAALELFKQRGFGETTMRDIARKAGMAIGAAYYYFDSKEKLVSAFYFETHRKIQERSREPLARLTGLRERLRALVEIHLDELRPHRDFVRELFRIAADPESPLSPFGEGTRQIREESTRRFAEAIRGSRVKIPRDLADHLPRLIWLYHMGVILFWIHDNSQGQIRTQKLVNRTLDWIVTAVKLSRLPVVAPLRKGAVQMLTEVEGVARAGDGESANGED
jgi:AcrR family transcriptional regulator